MTSYGKLQVHSMNLLIVLTLLLSPFCSHAASLASPLQLSSSSIDFGQVLPSTQSVPRFITVKNTGASSITLTNISISGPGSSLFKISANCDRGVPVDRGCSIQIAFAPKSEGIATATVSIRVGSSNSSQSVALIGQGSPKAIVDVIVYGATPAGIMAAIESAQNGKQVLLLEPTGHVGGMVSNGLGYSDGYDLEAVGGLPRTFYRKIYSYYGGSPASNGGHTFEPHVAEQVFDSMIKSNSSLSVLLNKSISSVRKNGTNLTALVTTDEHTYYGKEFIDASYTGDLMEKAGVSYTVGRESATQYDESLGGVSVPIQLSAVAIDPYVVPGDPHSGLLAHVGIHDPQKPGSADSAVMAYNYRLCISSDPGNQIHLLPPVNYDPAEFEILGREAVLLGSQLKLRSVIGPGALPNRKFDLNNVAEMFSTDEIGESFAYPEGGSIVRHKIEAEQKHYMQGLLYFLSTDTRIPQTVRTQVQALGLCKDEFTDNGGWPHQIYVREARRMIGEYVETQKDLELKTTIPDPIGLGGYAVDDHLNYLFNKDHEINIEFNRGFIPPLYPISYRILTPQESQATNLLVPVDVSASHIAYDSLRVEVTYMIMGQAAGAAAALAIDNNTSVQNVDYQELSKVLVSDKAILIAPR